ncbi:MAG: response regulator [Chitinophagaceae bacterium]|nr:MAG: response regulator [Chitinophagaceae bacterium]
MTKRALIIDDERLARTELKNMLADFPDIEVVGEAANANEGIEKTEMLSPDLLFLDIQMPDKTGFEMLSEMERTPRVIFTTAYDEYAIKAFEYNALDYMLKPIDPQRLADAIQKLQQEDKEKQDATNHNKLFENDQVFVKDGDHCWFVKLGNIRLFESVGNYARVYFDNNKPLILKSLNALEERLDDKVFFRANRKHIVNMRMIDKIDTYFNGGLILEMKGGEKIEVSRRQAVKFKDMMSL